MSNEAKLVRKQIRNVVQETLAEVLSKELVDSIHKELTALVNKRLDAIDKYTKTVLDGIDARSKDVQSYIVRNSK